MGSTDGGGLVQELYEKTLDESDRLFGEQYYGDFLNWGYWKLDTRTQIEACENLVELLLSLIPKHEGKLLEAGCGVGGVARHLTRYYRAEDLTAINVMEDQLAVCRRRVPAVRFLRMDAAKMEFADGEFDRVISLEAAMHFNTRQRFLHEAYRVLKPGGYLALADIIGFPVEPHSFVANPAEYARLLRETGFGEVRVMDITTESTLAHADHSLDYLQQKLAAGQIDQATFDRAALSRLARVAAGRYYVVAGARKPPSNARRSAFAEYLKTTLVKTASL
jgi:MPBQ/MSBQ methyltransferase